jgi:hypothetical protein
MVAETSAWGRAIVAALAADTQKVASADEVRNRQGSDNLREIARPNPKPAQTTTITQMPKPAAKQGGVATEAQRKYAKALLSQVGNDDTLIADLTGGAGIEQLSAAQAKQVIQDLLAIKKGEATLSYDGDGKATVSYKS